MVALIRRGLVEEGYAVDVAHTGEVALELAQAVPYDAVVLDIALPGIEASRSAGSCEEAASGPRS